MNTQPRILVLDAMGVLYQSGDDVAELLIPFVHRHNPRASVDEINETYLHASLGKITSTEFWKQLNLSPGLEDEYLSLHQLMNETREFLSAAVNQFETICCLSNDISEWSLKLRNQFALTNYVSNWVISGDVGYRKPSSEIYLALLNQLEITPSDVLFVDDRPQESGCCRFARNQYDIV